jgi:protein-tyrosine-phosphatase
MHPAHGARRSLSLGCRDVGRNAPVVVFVDSTNLCRAPAAAAVFAGHAATVGLAVHVRSAGTRAVHGAPASRRLRRATGPFLGALAMHRSAPFAGDMATSADLVLVMEPSHLDEVADELPAVLPRTFVWKDMLELSARVAPHGDGLAGWVARLHERRLDRDAANGNERLSAVSPTRGLRAHRRLVGELDTLSARTAALLAAASLEVRALTPEPRRLETI